MQNNAKTCRERAGACDASLAQSVPGVLMPSDDRLATLEGILLEQIADRIDGQWTYFIKSGPYVKIGFSHTSRAVKRRLALYRVTNPEGARLIALSPGGEQTEQRLHRRLELHRFRGEWFWLSPPVIRTMRYEGLWPSPRALDRSLLPSLPARGRP